MLAERTMKLTEQLANNERLLKETGYMFGMEDLKRKQEDPGRYEAVWHILLNICNTAWDVGCRVSSSAIAVDGGDALWGLHLPTGEAVCVSKGITAHPGLLSLFIRSLVELGYEDDPGIEHGDMFENNDSHYGGIHASDFDAAIPIFYDGELIAWASGVSHVMDCGAILPGSIGFMNPDAFSDGVPVTMEKVGENDKYYRWYEMRMRSRTRMPDWVLGDARGRLAGMITIRDKVTEVIDKYGVDFFWDAIREYVEDGRRYAMKRVKSQAVPGRIRKSNFKDLAMEGKRVILPQQDVNCLFNQPLEINISGDASVRFSLAGASGWVPFGQNITPMAMTSALMNAYSHMVGFDMFNWGAVASWDLETPPDGSWANPYPANLFAASGVAWAPAVMWMSSLYETFGRLYYTRGYVEEVAAGAATTLTAEFSGIGQYEMYVAGLTLEQASNGAPARGMADGENSAWCIYTPNADFGNAEVSELYYPIMYLGRNIEPDSGGYGKYRGGLGHTAIWMIKNTPGLEYQCGCAGIRSKVVGNHGMYGAYPTWPDRGGYAAGTNVKELIDAQKPLVHERGDPVEPNLEKNIKADVLESNAIAPFVTPHQLHEYDLIIHPVSGAQALGDPIERDPELVLSDLNKGWTRDWVAASVHGVVANYDEKTKEWTVDAPATERRRAEMREERKQRAVPFREWWQQERERVIAKENMASAVLDMWRSSTQLTPAYGAEIRAFWQLPEDFTF
ncbi:MAG: hydantoinase B/oxoprolinase family protein [Dehalococcoidia bacterium]